MKKITMDKKKGFLMIFFVRFPNAIYDDIVYIELLYIQYTQ